MLISIDEMSRGMYDTSRFAADLMAESILQNPESIRTAIDLSFEGSKQMAMRISRVLWIIDECKEELLKPYWDEIIEKLPETNNTSVQRNMLRIFVMKKASVFTEEQFGNLLDICFNWMNKLSLPVAVRWYSIAIINEFVRREPLLANEFIASLEKIEDKSNSTIKKRAAQLSLELKTKYSDFSNI